MSYDMTSQFCMIGSKSLHSFEKSPDNLLIFCYPSNLSNAHFKFVSNLYHVRKQPQNKCMIWQSALNNRNIHSFEKSPESLLKLWLTAVTTADLLNFVQQPEWDVYLWQQYFDRDILSNVMCILVIGSNVTNCGH